MRNSLTLFGACLGLLLGGAALADPKPKGAKPVPAQTIANLYAGKTQNWKSCNAGIYYGGGWEAQAFCEKDGKAVGLGKWSVSNKGRVCHQLTWFWQDGDGYGSKKSDADCISHLIDSDGVIWRKWDSDKDWWRLTSTKSMTKGFKHKAKINRLRRKLGV